MYCILNHPSFSFSLVKCWKAYFYHTSTKKCVSSCVHWNMNFLELVSRSNISDVNSLEQTRYRFTQYAIWKKVRTLKTQLILQKTRNFHQIMPSENYRKILHQNSSEKSHNNPSYHPEIYISWWTMQLGMSIDLFWQDTWHGVRIFKKSMLSKNSTF